MKKTTRFAIILSLIMLCCMACGGDNADELLQTEHVPGEEQAAVYTATPVPAKQDTTESAITPTEEPVMTPTMPLVPTMPAMPEEEPEFVDLYRAMPSGIKVNTEDVPEEQIRFCFYDSELAEHVKKGLAGQSETDLTEKSNLKMVRALYYKNDGKLYICDVIAEDTECENIRNLFYLLYQENRVLEDWTVLPEELTPFGYKMTTLSVENAEYLYIYK